jgi:hypothetical protein
MRREEKNQKWEEIIEKLLENDNPCKICLVKATCSKSFTGGSACKPLADRLTKVLNEAKNET